MRAVVIHGPKDLRIDGIAEQELGPADVRVRIEAGGICGSDLHYYHHGGTAAIRLRQPMVLGHEVAGTVIDIGADVEGIAVGARVAVNPSRHCGVCARCRQGLHNHCLDMRFMGSAMRFPHVQGAFREHLVVHHTQAFALAEGVSMKEGAAAEPLAVCLHAVHRAGSLVGKRVLITGCGPIGALLASAARYAGASEIVATDIHDFTLGIALKAGVDEAINVARDAGALAAWVAANGTIDVLFEASGNPGAFAGALSFLAPRGIAVQLGLGGEAPLLINTVVTREVDIRGSFRFDTEFALAVELMNRGRINVQPILTGTLPFEQADEAFRIASDRGRAVKMQLGFV